MRLATALILVIVGLLGLCSAESLVDNTVAAGLTYTQSTLYSDNNKCVIPEQQCLPDRLTGGVAAADFDNDGFVDLYVTVLNGADVLFRNRGDGTFQNVTQAVGLQTATSGLASNGALWVDIDNDGDQDLYLTTLGSAEAVNQTPNRFFLFINNNGVFTEDAKTRGLALDDKATHIGQTATAGDYDLDGLIDIVVTQWTGRKITAHTRIFHNLGFGYFEDVTSDSPIFSLTEEFFFAPVLADFDKDGWPDLLLVGDFSTSKFYWNNKGTFELSSTGCCSDLQGHGVTVADFNEDGYLDYFVTSVASSDSCLAPCGNRLFIFDPAGRKFVDGTDAANVRRASWATGCAFLDFDNDADLDLIITNGVNFTAPNRNSAYETDPMVFFANTNGRQDLQDKSAEILSPVDTGSGKGLITFDYDLDGKLDVFVARTGTTGLLYHNTDDSDNNYIKIQCSGILSNSEGIGAQITITIGAQKLYQELGVNSHFLGHSERTVHFGIGSNTRVDLIEVYWPASNLVSTQTNVVANQLILIDEPVFGFTDRTAAARVSYTQASALNSPNCVFPSNRCQPDRMSGGAAVADFDGDDFPDMYVTRLNSPGILFRNNRDGTFSDVTASVGLNSEAFHGNGAVWCDIDNDGDPDLFVTTIGTQAEPSLNRFFLFINKGGDFEEDAKDRGLAQDDNSPRFGTSATCADFDNDGLLDIHVNQFANGLDLPIRHSRLFRNKGDGSFEDVTADQGLDKAPRENNMVSMMSDFDRDGWVDLLIIGDVGATQFYHNNEGQFERADSFLPTISFNAHGGAVADYNGDGFLDIFTTGIGGGPSGTQTCLGTCGSHIASFNPTESDFVDESDARVIRRGYWGQGAVFGDFDNDQDLDLVVATGAEYLGGSTSASDATDPMLFYLQTSNPNGAFKERAQQSSITTTGQGKTVVSLDYDGDGDLDIFVVNTGTGGVLYRNENNLNGNGWLKVKARGTFSNAAGIGAQVTVTVTENGPVLYREIGADRTLQGHSSYIAHFGLGFGSEDIFRVEVYFPAFNRVVVLEQVARNQLIEVVEPLQPSPSVSPSASSTPSPSIFSTPSPTASPSLFSSRVATIVPTLSPSTTVTPSFSATPQPTLFECDDQNHDLNGVAIVINLSGVPLKPNHVDALRTLISTFLGINKEEVQVVKVTQFQASIILCDSDSCDVIDLLNAINSNDKFFRGTLLERASISGVVFDLPCSISFSVAASVSVADDTPSSDVAFASTQGITTYDFPPSSLGLSVVPFTFLALVLSLVLAFVV